MQAGSGGEQSSSDGFYQPPDRQPCLFYRSDSKPPACKIEPQSDHQQPGEEVAYQDRCFRGEPRCLGTDQARQPTSKRITQDSSGVVT